MVPKELLILNRNLDNVPSRHELQHMLMSPCLGGGAGGCRGGCAVALPGRDTPGGMGDPQGLASVRAGGVSPAKGNGDAAFPTPPLWFWGVPMAV